MSSPAEAARDTQRAGLEVECNDLLMYMRRLEPSQDMLARPRSEAVDAAFDGLVNGRLGSLVRWLSAVLVSPGDMLWNYCANGVSTSAAAL